MRRQKYSLVLALFLFSGSPILSFAETREEREEDLAVYMKEVLESALVQLEAESDLVSERDSLRATRRGARGVLSAFELSVRPHVGFQLPALATLALVPQVELAWKR